MNTVTPSPSPPSQKQEPKKNLPTKLRERPRAQQVNETFMRASSILRVIKYITAFVLVIFIVVMMTVCRDSITVDNFRYLARYLDIGASYSGLSDTHTSMDYPTDRRTTLALFRNDVAVLNSTSLTIRSLSGNDIHSTDLYYQYPTLVTGNKYLLCYDLGAKTYSLHNTFSTLYEGTTDFAITDADISENGYFALVTGSSQYRAEVSVYNDDFELICSVKKDKIITDALLSHDGQKLLVLSCSTRNGAFYSEVLLCDTETGETDYCETFSDVMAVQGYIREDGSFSVLCDRSILYYDSYYNCVAQKELDTLPTACDFSETGTVYAVSHNLIGGDATVYIQDKTGEIIRTADIRGKILCTESADDAVCVLTSDGFYRIPYQGNDIQYCEVQQGCIGLMLCENQGLYVVYASRAQYYNFADCFDT